MSKEADSFRQLAKKCRELAPSARDSLTRDYLAGMAEHLEEEADKIVAEEVAATLDDHLADSLDKLETSQRLLKWTDPKD